MDYSLTLNLPKTNFPMKANLAQKELEILRFWQDNSIYHLVKEQQAKAKPFILHDGPPYANGHIHLGTAFNKILKDIIIRSKNMTGYRAHYVPGWDCHGLPIEHQVDKNLGPKKKLMSKYDLRKLCREYAQKFIEIQKEEFQRLGVLGEWENPYLTMSHDYEATIIREFGKFVENKGVAKGRKPVHWCSSCQTALAEAEVEYIDHSSPSICVKFPVQSDLSSRFPNLPAGDSYILIWTTTPWTIPANLAVAVHPDYEYAACLVDGEIWFIAKDLVKATMEMAGLVDYKVITIIHGQDLVGLVCLHPFYQREAKLVPATYITLDQGTGFVHIAPGHGQEDYEIGLQHGLSLYAPVDQEGKFTHEVEYFAGQRVFEANPAIVNLLREKGRLVYEKSITHSYPHCWRCKNPIIFRATEQWFISMEKNDLRRKALEQIRQVKWIPAWGESRINNMIENRPDWCISRQRSWGVPITVFYCQSCNQTILDPNLINHIADLVVEEGIDIWFQREANELMPKGFTCPQCGGAEFTKDMNILDVWFDSGVSFAAVLEARADLGWPADLYLEGSDQHRGWFHSSLLASVGTRGIPPYRSVLTHGFVVDGQGKKMSKSAGNVIAPQEVINKLGAEILRLWVCSEDYKEDIRISENILNRLSEAYRRIRNTCRYLLGNLEDFHPQTDRVPYEQMEEIDQWVLHKFQELTTKISQAYETYEFHLIFHSLHNFCTVDLSSFYLDISKDRMYTHPANSLSRKSGQTVMYEIILGMVKLMSPVLCFTAEEIWKYLPDRENLPKSVYLSSFPELQKDHLNPNLVSKWESLLKVRGEVAKTLESARANKLIGHSLEACVEVILGDSALYSLLNGSIDLLKTILIVSAVKLQLNTSIPTEEYTKSEILDHFYVKVTRAEGGKCVRCWKYDPSVGKSDEHPGLCEKCLSVILTLPSLPLD